MSEELVEIELVPVEVFGENDCCEHGQSATCRSAGYGLMDAVQSWSDCNRAMGKIYRVEDTNEPGDSIPARYREPGDTIGVFIRKRDLPWLQKRFGEDHDGG